MDRRFSSYVGGDWRKEATVRYPEVVLRPPGALRSRRPSSVIQNGNGVNHRHSAVPSLYCLDEAWLSGVHPMTVALPSPIHKVDYSVTKGGARTWAVLLVFMFLCSSLYTVFSAKEIAEIAVDLDGDGSVDLDDDVADNIDEVVEQQRRAAKVTAHPPPQRGNEKVQKESHYHGSHESVSAASDDDEEDGHQELETQLFAGLRRKIESNMKKVQDMMQGATENHEEEDEEEKEEEKKEIVPKRQKKRERKQRKVEKVEEEEEKEEQEADKEEEKVKEPVRQKKEPKRRKQRQQVESEEEEDEEEQEEEEKEKEEEEKNDEDEVEEKETNEEEKMNEDDDGDDDEDDEEIPQRQRKQRRRHSSRAITAGAQERECRRKHCPPANTAEPRKALLKRKKGESSSSKRYRPLSRAQIEEYEDDIPEDDEEEEEKEEESVEPVEEPVMEVIALKKYRSSGREAYKRHAITNRDDHRHRHELDQADFLVEKHNYEEAIALFDAVLRVNPDSPRAHFGKGRAYDIRSEYSATEKDADRAIKEYEQVLENDETPDALYRQAASRLIEKSRFRGQMHRCLRAQRSLIDRFPEEINLQTDIGLTFLMMKRYDDARKVFKDVATVRQLNEGQVQIIEIDQNNAVAQAYYGFILKICDHDIEGGVNYMRRGLRLGGDNIIDAKFYYQLGHGLMMLGKEAEAYGVYEKGAELGLFLSAEQRSMYNMEGLTGRPWWGVEQTGYSKHLKALERNWVAIRAEALKVWEDEEEEWIDMNEEITVDGEWKSFRLMHNGFFDDENCQLTPQTCAMLKDFKTQSNATKSEMFLSILTSGTQVLPHCGPSNTRLQAQMGLIVPSEARIRVGHDQRGWKTGKFIVFDDSFEHAVQFDGASSSSFRLVLVIDLWHPEVDPRLRIDPDN